MSLKWNSALMIMAGVVNYPKKKKAMHKGFSGSQLPGTKRRDSHPLRRENSNQRSTIGEAHQHNREVYLVSDTQALVPKRSQLTNASTKTHANNKQRVKQGVPQKCHFCSQTEFSRAAWLQKEDGPQGAHPKAIHRKHNKQAKVTPTENQTGGV